MSKQMKSDPTETIGKRLTEIRRRLRHVSASRSPSYYDEQVFFSSAIEDVQFLLDLVKELGEKNG